VAYELLRLSDGRDVEFATNDVASAAAVIFHQGTCADLCAWTSWLDELAAAGVRAVAFNRSGYGRSSPADARRTVDVWGDVAQLASHLGLTSFVSVGWSGGGSHALATSLDPRCRGVVTLAGIAPYDVEDLDFYKGMKTGDVAEYHAALRDISEVIEIVSAGGLGDQWCEPDRVAMTTAAMGEVRASMERTSSFGWRCLEDDYNSYLSPWGFDVEDIAVPVVVFQGGLDGNVPPGHARWLVDHIPGAELRFTPDDGHISLVFSHRDDILATARGLLFSGAEPQ
jgi:pimeloyl-ACP methyl ester carboxylesterase